MTTQTANISNTAGAFCAGASGVGGFSTAIASVRTDVLHMVTAPSQIHRSQPESGHATRSNSICKLPMTEVMGFPPRWRFGPRSRTVTGGLHAQRSAGANCSVRSGVLPPGCIRRGVGAWRPTFATATRRGDRLAHTAFMQRDLPSLHHHGVWRKRRGVIRSDGRGLPTEARASGPFWTTHTTMTHARMQPTRVVSKSPAGHSAVACSASDALPPTRERVGFRATQL